MKTLTRAALPAVIGLALTGCASMPLAHILGGGYGYGQQTNYPNSADVYDPSQAQHTQQVQLGTVISVRSVWLAASKSAKGLSTGVGGAVGGVIGSSVGHGHGRELATIAGVLGGAVAGDKIAQSEYTHAGLEITVKLASGRTIAVAQDDDVRLRAGEQVQVITDNAGVTRIAPLSTARGVTK